VTPAYVAVVGSGEAAGPELSVAEEVGRGVAARGAVLVCGGLGGVMEAACRVAGAGGWELARAGGEPVEGIERARDAAEAVELALGAG
jgi:predicted Rossmann-fold nucleotide-binding protein